MSNSNSPTELNPARLDSEIERRATKIWGYVRDHRNSLSAETHIRRLREMVQVKFVHFENVVEALRAEPIRMRSEVDRKNAIIKRRDATIRELRAELRETKIPTTV